MTNETLETLKNRRSTHGRPGCYKPDQVEEEKLEAILEAGTYAPTGAGKQSPVIVAVQDPALVKKLSALNAAEAAKLMPNMPAGMDPFYGAPTVCVVLADKTASTTWMEDAVLVAGNLMNAAASVGVDSCYIYRAEPVFASEEGQALLKEWGLGENYVGVANIIMGYASGEKPAAAPRKKDYIIRK